MNLSIFFKKRSTRIILAGLLGVIIYALISTLFFQKDPLFLFASSLFKLYLNSIISVVNLILQWFNSNIIIENNVIVFGEKTAYFYENEKIINNWKDYVLFKKWSAFILLFLWLPPVAIRKKLVYTILFGVTHFISVISALILITIIGPKVVDPGSITELRPNTFGAIAMLTLASFWIIKTKPAFLQLLKKVRVNVKLSDKLLIELIILFFIYSLLRNFIVPYFNFNAYVHFLLSATKMIVSWFGHQPRIEGPYLIGPSGTLFMAKWCLGFITMYVFTLFIYLTGGKTKASWYFIGIGIVFLHIINILRLSFLYMLVQTNIDLAKAEHHHEIYNIIVYIIIFILWIIWYEKFYIKRKRKSVKA